MTFHEFSEILNPACVIFLSFVLHKICKGFERIFKIQHDLIIHQHNIILEKYKDINEKVISSNNN